MNGAGYSALARFYDSLTDNVAYDAWAALYVSLMHTHALEPETVLDLGCGTGSLLYALSERGIDTIGVDASADCLSVAAEKCRALAKRPLLLHQRLETLDLYGTVDAAVCSLDVVNYLADQQSLMQAFTRIGLFIRPGGLFIFDVKTEAHCRVLDTQAYIRETDDCFCAWEGEYNAARRLVTHRIHLFVPKKDSTAYHRYTETHIERVHTREELTAAGKAGGMEVLAVLDEAALPPQDQFQERQIYILRKTAAETEEE